MDYLNYLDLMDQWDSEAFPRKTKKYKDRCDPLNELSETEFRQKYQFSKDYVRKIVDLIKDDIRQDRRGGGTTPDLQVLTALRTWGTHGGQGDSADIHGLSQQCITYICRRVALALASKASSFISMPITTTEQEETMERFHSICGFRHVVGVIDCTQIKIKKVTGDTEMYYLNRDGYYSLNVQIICDASLRIRDIVAHWGGSTHDSTIFEESQIKQRFESGEFTGRLIGDTEYTLKPYLFTPFLNPASAKEEAYNQAHIRTRNTIERCFKLWKQRFKCMLAGFTVSLQHSELYIVALAVLHNIAIDMGEVLDEVDVEVPSQSHSQMIPQETQTGLLARNSFMQTYF